MNTNDYLHYINYEFTQDDRFLKAGTDTALLGCFLDNLSGKTVLDIGTNTGALLLYAHAKNAGMLYGIDIHEDALKLAEINLSRYTDYFELFLGRVQETKLPISDVIVCNPPFFELNSAVEDKNLREAMFEETLPIDDLFACFKKNLKPNGSIYMIYNADRLPELFEQCTKYKLKIMQIQFAYNKNAKYANRVLLKLKHGKMTKLKVKEPILTYSHISRSGILHIRE